MRVQGLIGGGRDVGPLLAAVHGDLDQAVAGAGPEHVHVERRGRERGDGALRGRRHGRRIFAGVGGHFPFFAAREVAADGRPAMSAVGGFPDAGGCVEQNGRILGGPVQGLSANGARGRRTGGHGLRSSAASSAGRPDVGFLSGEAIVDGDFAAVDKIGIFRIGRGVAVLFDAHRMPVVERDFAIHAAAIDASGAGILLAAA